MASLHTGLMPADHGAGARQGPNSHQRSGLNEDVETLAERLRRRGYVNGAVVTNPYLSMRYGLHRGFDRYIDLSRRALLQRGLRRSMLWRAWVPKASDDPVPRALQLHSRLVEGRAFLWVHAIEPHAPYTRLDSDPHEDCEMPDCFSDWRTEGDMDVIRGLYEADLARLDAQLDPLLDELIAQDRLVVLVADHGEAFGEHDGQAHGHGFWDEVTHIPLLVWGEGQGEDEGAVDLTGLHEMLVDWADGGSAAIEPTETSMAGLLFGEESSACLTGRTKAIDGVGVFDLDADPLELRPMTEDPPCAYRPLTPSEGTTVDVGVLRALGYIE
jgi:arylsulfatase A-like enzyme